MTLMLLSPHISSFRGCSGRVGRASRQSEAALCTSNRRSCLVLKQKQKKSEVNLSPAILCQNILICRNGHQAAVGSLQSLLCGREEKIPPPCGRKTISSDGDKISSNMKVLPFSQHVFTFFIISKPRTDRRVHFIYVPASCPHIVHT